MRTYSSRCPNIRNQFLLDLERQLGGLAAGNWFPQWLRTGIRPKCNSSQTGTAYNAIAIKRSQVHDR